MNRNWTFGQKLAAGYAVMLLFTIAISAVAVYALRTTVASKDRVINVDALTLIEAQKLYAAIERRAAMSRGYLLSREHRFLDQLQVQREEFVKILGRMRSLVDTDEGRRLVDAVDRLSVESGEAVNQAIALARAQDRPEAERIFEEMVLPARERLIENIRALLAFEERQLRQAEQAASDAASRAIALMVIMAGLAVMAAIVVSAALIRLLGRQIGTAVGHVQSSSSELQAAATQQVSGAREQANAMNEISTTIGELVASSRQIAESAQRVAQIAEQTAAAARHGEGTVEKGQDSVAGIRRQVDVVVTHMLDLGRKSQEIGAVLDIVSELAEQTNILAINATIEAVGAGEAGRRFAVVADEIRKLADRVAHSTKEIRGLIEDVRGAVNTTVMATEGSAKAVDAGSRQFTEVAVAFKQIAGLVATTTDAAREIELSTRQQASAAEQVRAAVSDVAQTTHESEASTGQTLQTASQLAGLSRELLRLIQPQAAT